MDAEGCAVFILEGEEAYPPGGQPLMLENVLDRPALAWAAERCVQQGIGRFFLVLPQRLAPAALACFPKAERVTVSERHGDLMDFLDTPAQTLVLCRSALPVKDAGIGFAYRAPGHVLGSVWRERMTNAVSQAEAVPGWLPLIDRQTLHQAQAYYRRHCRETG